MTAQEEQVAAAAEQMCNMFFALAGDSDNPAVADQADDALAVLDAVLLGAETTVTA
jgi:hypothetical protein